MELTVLGSSSTGNGYLLRASSGESLVIEAGIRIQKLKQATDFDLSQIRGVLISHSHNDHAGKAYEYLRAGLMCYTSPETEQEILKSQSEKLDTNLSHNRSDDGKSMIMHHYNLDTVPEKVVHYTGEFSFMPFSLVHDVKCYGYLVKHPEMGQMVFITDTLYCKYKFKGLSHVIVEANYSEEILDENILRGRTVMKVRERVVSSHMSLETCKEFIRSNDLRDVRNIVLIHLSSSNSDAKAFSREINQMTGKRVYVAEAGMKITLNKNPF